MHPHTLAEGESKRKEAIGRPRAQRQNSPATAPTCQRGGGAIHHPQGHCQSNGDGLVAADRKGVHGGAAAGTRCGRPCRLYEQWLGRQTTACKVLPPCVCVCACVFSLARASTCDRARVHLEKCTCTHGKCFTFIHLAITWMNCEIHIHVYTHKQYTYTRMQTCSNLRTELSVDGTCVYSGAHIRQHIELKAFVRKPRLMLAVFAHPVLAHVVWNETKT
jgi:hypothetical protein